MRSKTFRLSCHRCSPQRSPRGAAQAQTGAAAKAAVTPARRQCARGQGRSARRHRQEDRRHQARRRAHDAGQRHLRSHARRGNQLPVERWPLRHPRRHDRSRLRRQPFRDPPPRHSRAHARHRAGKRDAGVLAQGIRSTPSRCSPTSTAAIAAACIRRSPSTTGSAFACVTCSSRARGPDTESWHKAEAVWCASNRNDALTRAKNGEDIKSPKCPTDIVKRDYELGPQARGGRHAGHFPARVAKCCRVTRRRRSSRST